MAKHFGFFIHALAAVLVLAATVGLADNYLNSNQQQPSPQARAAAVDYPGLAPLCRDILTTTADIKNIRLGEALNNKLQIAIQDIGYYFGKSTYKPSRGYHFNLQILVNTHPLTDEEEKNLAATKGPAALQVYLDHQSKESDAALKVFNDELKHFNLAGSIHDPHFAGPEKKLKGIIVVQSTLPDLVQLLSVQTHLLHPFVTDLALDTGNNPLAEQIKRWKKDGKLSPLQIQRRAQELRAKLKIQ